MRGTINPSICNALTIDVEDYFQVSAFSGLIARSAWDGCECRIEGNIEKILSMLSGAGVRATFFVLGWIAERYPHVVRQIVAAGHELASHGYLHERAHELLPVDFLQDVQSSKKLLEDISGLSVLGYRAPSFSIGPHNLWALEMLEQAGYRYSSSIYPVRHDHYGDPYAPRFAHQVGVSLLEVPPSTCRLFSANFPSAGGGYFRLLPYALSRWMLRRINCADGAPVVFYFHPWELDVDQPRIGGLSAKSKFRHYLNLHRMEARLQCLLRDFHWGRMDEIFLNSTHGVQS